MKLAALFLTPVVALLTSLSAQAIVLPEGSFVPERCGAQTGFVGVVRAVCIGHVIGQEARVVQFRLANETERIYQIESQQNLLVGTFTGNTESVLFLVSESGEKMPMKVILSAEQQIQAVQGNIENVGYFVPRFRQMMVMQ